MTSADDQTVLDLLKALNPPLHVHDGDVPDSDPDTKVITAELPYVLFFGFPDDDTPGDSLAGGSGAHLSDFQLSGVGETREQAKAALERAAAALNRQFVTFPGDRKRFVRRTNVRQSVRRDDTWTSPGGKPLFYGVERYAVLI